MENPVNFDNLLAITDGDAALEAELLRSFLVSSAQCIEGLRIACSANNQDEWKKRAHAFKGVCLNLGAVPLSELCRKAQDDYRMPLEDRQRMMAAIEAEFLRVRAVVESHL